MGFLGIPSPGDVLDGVKDVGGAVVDGVQDLGGDVLDGVQDVGGGVLDGLQDLGGGVLDGVTGLAGGAVDLFGDVGQGIVDIASDIAGAVDALWERTTSWLGGLVSDLLGGIMDAIGWVVDSITSWYQGYWDVLQALVEGFDAPDTLADTARAWRSGPVARLSGLAGSVSEQALLADEGWDSPAGRAYASTVPGQAAAVEAVRSVAEATAATLEEAADGLTTLYAEAGGITGKVYAAINGSPGELFSLEALSEMVHLDLDQLKEVAEAVVAFGTLMAEKQAALAQQVQQHPALPGGAWPQAALV